MKLAENAYRWAITHLFRESDTDLFPRPFELEIIEDQKEALVKLCKEIDIGSYQWNASRRFIVPKDEISYRVATQLDIVDSILFAAIIHEFGAKIEAKRISKNDNTVFSYRFAPDNKGSMYSNVNAWTEFWKSCKLEASFHAYVVVLDISDFYNQIYHHTIENELRNCDLPNEVNKSIIALLGTLTQKNSRGIPVGPHGSHLLAELSLIPFDESLVLKDIKFKRYADDIVIFCSSIKETRIRINQVAEILDKQQRLVLQKQKTEVLRAIHFQQRCRTILMETPESEGESQLLEIIKSYTGGNSYTKISISEITDAHLKILSKRNIISLLNGYLKNDKPNYEKIRWIYRRLSQIGIAHAVDYSIRNFEALIPALNDVCLYLNSCGRNYKSDWKMVGSKILEILDDEVINSNEFYKISLLNLFVYNSNLNHFKDLIKIFKNSSELIKRKILLAALNQKSAPWLRELKEDYNRFDVWTKRAFLIAAKNLPEDERNFFYKGVQQNLASGDVLEKIIIKWSKR